MNAQKVVPKGVIAESFSGCGLGGLKFGPDMDGSSIGRQA